MGVRFKVASDVISWQLVWYVMGGCWSFQWCQKIVNVFKIYASTRFCWFLVYAKVSDQCIQYMSDTRIMCQKLEICWDTYFRSRLYDLMVGTWAWKSNYTYNMCRKFVSDDLYLSAVNGCDRVRPCVAGTTNMTCSYVSTSLRHFKANHPWHVITQQQYTHIFLGVGSCKLCSAPNFAKYSDEDVKWYLRWRMVDITMSGWRAWPSGGSKCGAWEF